jgi:BMFP domain-containing protein YqiC
VQRFFINFSRSNNQRHPQPHTFIMSQGQKFFEDVTKLMSGALGTADAMRQEFEVMLCERFQSLCRDMRLVTRDEYDTLHDLLVTARREQEDLKARVLALEAKLPRALEP